jgi:hypothetical protein
MKSPYLTKSVNFGIVYCRLKYCSKYEFQEIVKMFLDIFLFVMWVTFQIGEPGYAIGVITLRRNSDHEKILF